MGVLPCSRRGCLNIMCDHLSYTHGYLCWECKAELIGRGPCNVAEFMNTSRTGDPDPHDSWVDIVNEEFEERESGI